MGWLADRPAISSSMNGATVPGRIGPTAAVGRPPLFEQAQVVGPGR